MKDIKKFAQTLYKNGDLKQTAIALNITFARAKSLLRACGYECTTKRNTRFEYGLTGQWLKMQIEKCNKIQWQKEK